MSLPVLSAAARPEPEAQGRMVLDGREVPFYPGESLLEAARREGVDIPSFCYHSELSAYGACRLCLVEVEGRGLVASCSTRPEGGMVVHTSSPRLRRLRRIVLELLLANHHVDCPTCPRSANCRLQELSHRLGVRRVRYDQPSKEAPRDESGPALVRDPARCILCGDCVRMCGEIQGLGVLDFAHRGARTAVGPAFGRPLAEVDCVHCGQCAAVCPTAAITVRSEVDDAWTALQDPDTVVIAQLAPAVRVALGEEFGLPPGQDGTGLLVAALRRLGFDRVFDTVFAADLTTVEETAEFQERLAAGGPFPHLTSCCPAWVKFCEQYFPDLLQNLSTCRSPQQMMGSLLKRLHGPARGIDRAALRVVSIMPCTAKKFEARRPEHARGGVPDVDVVLTTVEAARLLREAGIVFAELQPEPPDNPLGLATGGGTIFGASGGVTEAVLRVALDEAGLPQPAQIPFHLLRGCERVREAEIALGPHKLRVAVVSGLKAAAELLGEVRAGRRHYHLIEVMACPGGCVGGGGQPPAGRSARSDRQQGLYRIDASLQLRVASHNPFVRELYQRHLEKPGSEAAHALLHTTYAPRRRLSGSDTYPVLEAEAPVSRVSVCVGTGCFLRGSHAVLETLLEGIRRAGLDGSVGVGATFCLERCDRGVSVRVDEEVITGVTPASAGELVDRLIRRVKAGREQA